MSVKAYWACKDLGNIGDWLTPFIIKHITGKDVEHTKTGPHYMVVGSILREATLNSTVLGAGFGAVDQRFSKKAKVIFVRGPHTALWVSKNMGLTVKAINDPAVIMPMIFNPDVTKQYRLGVVPHYIDFDNVKATPDIKIISPLQTPESFVLDVLQCERVISSSLHGLILAHAYGIPALWVEFSDNVVGRGFKFRDYFEASGLEMYSPKDMRHNKVNADDIDLVPRQLPNFTEQAKEIYTLLETHLK